MMMELPGWMKQAVKEQVISETEAREIHALCLDADSEFVTMPKHLNTASERILLWELEAGPTVH